MEDWVEVGLWDHGNVKVTGMASWAEGNAMFPVGKIALGAGEEGHDIVVMEGRWWNMGIGFPVLF